MQNERVGGQGWVNDQRSADEEDSKAPPGIDTFDIRPLETAQTIAYILAIPNARPDWQWTALEER